MTEQGIDFDKVELVREKMLFSVKDMAALFGVSRITYYKWVEGGSMRAANIRKVKDILRAILPLLRDGHWPPVGTKTMSSEDRLNALLEMLGDEE